MIKLAIFVEGYCELLFIDRLVTECLGTHNVTIDLHQIRGGAKSKNKISTVRAHTATPDKKYYFLIYDCGGDEQVKTRIMDEHKNLTEQGYIKIIGIRDVRPKFTHADIPKLESGLRLYIKTALIPVEFILSVMELEAWFLAEFTHYTKIDATISLDKVRALGFDPERDDLSLRLHPAGDLNSIYQIAGKNYDKSNVNATISALDYENIYVELAEKIPYLKKLRDSIISII